MHPFGVHITRVRLTGTPSGCPIMCTLRVHIWVPHRGTHLRHDNGAPIGCPICAPLRGAHYFFFSGRTSTRLRLVPGSYAHPMGVHMGAPSGHPLQHVQKGHPLGDNPFGVNFGQNYRDLGHFVRVTFFWPKLPAPLRGTSMGTPQGYPYVGTLSGTHISGQFFYFFFVVAPCAPTSMGTHFSVPLREIIAPSGQACMHVGCPMEVHIFRSVPLRDFFSFAGSFGPSNGHPMGTHVGTPMGHPLFKNSHFMM